MKDSICEFMTVKGYAGTLYDEVINICGVRFKFYYARPEKKGETRFYVVSGELFSAGKGRYLRRKVRQYLNWAARRNENLGWHSGHYGVPPVRMKWY